MFGWGERDDSGGCEDIHDPLFVRALSLADGGEEELILGFDLLFFSREIADRYRGALCRRTGLAARQVFLTRRTRMTARRPARGGPRATSRPTCSTSTNSSAAYSTPPSARGRRAGMSRSRREACGRRSPSAVGR